MMLAFSILSNHNHTIVKIIRAVPKQAERNHGSHYSSRILYKPGAAVNGCKKEIDTSDEPVTIAYCISVDAFVDENT